VLINLHETPPPFFSRFERLAEIVSEDGAAAARERFRFYRERGYELRTHNMAERG
jgi:DNA polymerase III subunit chi